MRESCRDDPRHVKFEEINPPKPNVNYEVQRAEGRRKTVIFDPRTFIVSEN